jgi:hypothetical protein
VSDEKHNIDWDAFERDVAKDADPFESIHTNAISPEMLAKRLLWDVTPCDMEGHVVEVAKYLGYPPASEDVEQMEHDESHARANNAGILLPFVAEMAAHAAKAVAGSMIVGSGDQDHMSEADRDETIDKLRPIIAQTSFGILAELLDVGILHTPHFATFLFTTEDESTEDDE